MIKFFRKIRKQLANDNKPLKYMRYAIGEIVLVVIGILIALSINNWNEDRINTNREKEIVKLVYDELAVNSRYIDARSNEFESRIPYAIDLLNMSGSKAKSFPPDSLAKYTVELFSVGAYSPFTMNLNRIINSDQFNLIQIDSLQSMLGEYRILLDKSQILYSTIQAALNRWELIEYQIMTSEYSRQEGANLNFITYDKIDAANFDTDTKNILSNPKFAAIVSSHLNSIQFLLERFNEINRYIDNIREFIEKHYDL
jgi:hypothetical protein